MTRARTSSIPARHVDRRCRAAVHLHRREAGRRSSARSTAPRSRPAVAARPRRRAWNAHACRARGRLAGPARPHPGDRAVHDRDSRHAHPDPDPDRHPSGEPDDRRRPRARDGEGQVPGSKRYVELDSTIGIPVGSSVDTRKGARDADVDPEGGRPAADRRLLRRAVQGHAVAGASRTSRSPSSSRPARRRAARTRPPRRRRSASCGVTARARSAPVAGTAPPPYAVRGGSWRTPAPARSPASRRAR